MKTMAGNVLRFVAAIVVALLVIFGVDKVFIAGDNGMKITAHFTAAVGLYKGSSVRVLGVKVGDVKSITPEGTSVRVVMSVKKSVKIPADADAYIIPPSLISDRYVQLAPVFTSGPTMQSGADIPLARTRTPVELDAIIADLDKLFQGLGPNGVNKNGALSRAVGVGAEVLKGSGADLNNTLVQLSNAVTALANSKDDFASTISNLANFSQVLADSDSTVRQFSGDLASASQQLADQRKDLGLALKNLGSALSSISALIKDHRASLTTDIGSLKSITDDVIKRQRELKEFLDDFPLLTTNIGDTIDLRSPNSISLPIRANNQQTDDPAPIVLCQVLQPLLKLPISLCSSTGKAGSTK